MKRNSGNRERDDFNSKIIVMSEVKRNKIKHVIFDFDGTINLIHEGWQKIMLDILVDNCPSIPGETDEAKKEMLFGYISKTMGQATELQMDNFVIMVKERGGNPKTGRFYKQHFVDLLQAHIKNRKRLLSLRVVQPSKMMVYGSKYMLDLLKDKGLLLHLVSGTDEQYVREEADLLGITHYFGEHIHGILKDYIASNKDQAFNRIIETQKIKGDELIVFGDGYVEIECGKQLGAMTVGVATDEQKAHEGLGIMSDWKKERLIQAGADVIVPDFNRADLLVELLCL